MTCLLLCLISNVSLGSEPKYGLSYFGTLKYPEGFPHFDYVNPNAPKGGKASEAIVGTFNNLHPFIDKGRPAICVNIGCMLIYDRLLKPAEDELASDYGLLAESIELADDFTWVNFTLNAKARWHDGVPVTVDDVIFTFYRIKNESSLRWRLSYKDIISAEQVGPRTVRFRFSEFAPKTPQLAKHMSMFWTMPKHYWEGREWHATTLEPPLGSGPYRIAKIDPGHKIVYERVKDYWAKDLNVNQGYHNFDTLEYQYFLDRNVVVEAHKAKVFDFRRESSAKSWANAYNFEARDRGFFKMDQRVIRKAIGMIWGIAFNTRIEKLRDVRVREALTLAHDFEWANRVLQYNEHKRSHSFFQGSGMSSEGTLPSKEELSLLEPYRGEIPARVFTDVFELPVSSGMGRNRDALTRATELLEEAGWVVRNYQLVNEKTGEPFTLEFLLRNVNQERILMRYADSLKRLCISTRVRTVEASQLSHRLRHFDFEATALGFGQGALPYHWVIRSRLLSANADRVNTDNYTGIKSAAVDDLVERVIAARSEEEMNTAGRALDRILLWNFLVIPAGYPPAVRIVYWDRFGDPKILANRTGWPDLWWLDSEKDSRLKTGWSN